MHAPSILPWIAHRHGISVERAEALWDQAVMMADFHYGTGNAGPNYWKYAVNTFLRLARCDGAAMVEEAATGEMIAASAAVETVEIQGRIGEITLSAVERMLRLGTEMWAASVSCAANDDRIAAVRRH